MSLYRFKSRETSDLVMLHADGERLLGILGKNADTGIIEPDEMPAAVTALKSAVAAEEIEQKRLLEEAQAKGHSVPDFESVSLRLRTVPFLEMLERCEAAKVSIVWGV